MRQQARVLEVAFLKTLSAGCWRREVIRQRSGARPAEEQPCLLRLAFARDGIRDAYTQATGGTHDGNHPRGELREPRMVKKLIQPGGI